MKALPVIQIHMCVAALLLNTSSAGAQSFDFEDVAPGYYSSSLTVMNGGLVLTVTPEGAPNGFAAVISGSAPPLFGTRSVIGSLVDPLALGQFTPLRFTFSSPVSAITFAFGDGGGDEDSPVTIRAFNSGNVLLGTLTDTYPQDFSEGKTISGTFNGASYFIVSSGSVIGNADSLFWEIPSVTPVPEPSTLLLGGLGVVVMLGRCARGKRAALA